MASSVQVVPLRTANQSLRFASSLQESTERLALQSGHRLAAIAIFAILAGWVMIYQNQSNPWPTAVAFIAADLGLCAAIIARIATPRINGETTSLFIVNLILIALSLQTMLFTRLDLIRSTLEKFFAAN